MVLGKKNFTKGMTKMNQVNSQLADQGSAVTPVAYIVTGAINRADSVIDLNDTTPKIEATIADIEPGRILVITQIDGGTAGHTVTLTTGTFDGTNNTATFNAQFEALVLVAISPKRFLILKNYGSVALSSV